MPIQMDDPSLFAAAATKAQTPKFFSRSLTGSGKSTGLLNSSTRPGRYPLGEGRHSVPVGAVATKTRSTGSSITTSTIPLGTLTQYTLEEAPAYGATIPVPVPEDLFHITSAATKLAFDAFLGMTPQGIIITEDGGGDKVSRSKRILYRMELYVLPVGSSPARARVVDHSSGRNAPLGEGVVLLDWSYAPLDDVEDLIATATSARTGTGNPVFVDADDLAAWMDDYDVHDRVCRLAEQWAGTDIAEHVGDYITEVFAAGTPSEQSLNRLASQLRYLETYNVSLEAYRQIHTTINAVCPPNIATTLSKQNLNLLMSHTLEELSSFKSQLPSPPVNAQAASALPAHFSTQQRAAITTDEPLTLVQAGAGTGKSTVILARIAYLEAAGVDPSEITVLSFTNAAADNIKDKNPRVGSMTIARMIHDIYSLNHPRHDLSSVDTILNSLDIFYPMDDLAKAFRRRLLEMDKKLPGSTTALNAFVEHYQPQVLEILDRIGQTCLELEIILAYQMIDTMAEPPHVSSRYLIIDEVQDNSIFEFIYALKYVAKHKENLLIVGDASQTLYEFRASNPKALNALESSGVFATYQLTTNYRSNQAILDFANVHLSNIDANQFAQIQLQADSLAAVTAKEFTEKVRLDYREYRQITKFRTDLSAYMHSIVRPYVDECLARGEQVAFLAYDRASVKIMETALAKEYPAMEVANLVSDRAYSTTVFSEFIKKHWDEVRQVPDIKDAAFAVTHGIDTNLPTLIRGDDKKARPAVMRMVSDWWLETHTSIAGWLAQVSAGMITDDEYFDTLRQSLLSFEISRNAIKQSLLNQRNKERKEKNLQSKARLVVSTIHGAKGLEFDNVVVIHKFDPQMDEANKRMYYVALTRAINTEFILSYGSVKKPRIESDYALVVDSLLHKERVAALRAQGVDLDTMAEDDVEAALALLLKQAEEAAESGDDDALASLPPASVGYSTRGDALPSTEEGGGDGDDDGEGADDTSAFTSATA